MVRNRNWQCKSIKKAMLSAEDCYAHGIMQTFVNFQRRSVWGNERKLYIRGDVSAELLCPVDKCGLILDSKNTMFKIMAVKKHCFFLVGIEGMIHSNNVWRISGGIWQWRKNDECAVYKVILYLLHFDF